MEVISLWYVPTVNACYMAKQNPTGYTKLEGVDNDLEIHLIPGIFCSITIWEIVIEGILKSLSLFSTQLLEAFGDGPVAGVSGGQGTESWLACLEFEPSATKDPPCRAEMHVKSIEN
ncbi:hypothetical protein TNCV_3796171 [Trichonephila clavipes]|nr:hypothetical protein TNCV_3796171 [Trichonephila clavipes]